jgi:hypothetical protein
MDKIWSVQDAADWAARIPKFSVTLPDGEPPHVGRPYDVMFYTILNIVELGGGLRFDIGDQVWEVLGVFQTRIFHEIAVLRPLTIGIGFDDYYQEPENLDRVEYLGSMLTIVSEQPIEVKTPSGVRAFPNGGAIKFIEPSRFKEWVPLTLRELRRVRPGGASERNARPATASGRKRR